MWFGESEANVRELFDKARQSAPCVLFFATRLVVRDSSRFGDDARDKPGARAPRGRSNG